jgi:hypothetical protein
MSKEELFTKKLFETVEQLTEHNLESEFKKHRHGEIKLEETPGPHCGVDGFGYGDTQDEAFKDFIKHVGIKKKYQKSIVINHASIYKENPLYPTQNAKQRWYFKVRYNEI